MENIKNSLFSSPLLQVLDVFLLHGHEPLSDREVFERVPKAKYSSVHQALQKLAELKITTRERKGKYVLNQLQVLPWLAQLKIASNLLEINPFVEKIKDFASKIVLFGSRAQGVHHAESDFDLFVTSSQKEKLLTAFVQDPQAEKIQLICKTPTEALDFFERETVLANEIRKGIVLWEM